MLLHLDSSVLAGEEQRETGKGILYALIVNAIANVSALVFFREQQLHVCVQ